MARIPDAFIDDLLARTDLVDVLSLLAPAGNITLSNLGTTNIELLNAGNNLTINSTGNIDDGATGVITVANMASLTAGTALAPADILFNNANNIFNSLTVSAANNLDVYSTTSLTLNEIRATTLINMVTEGQMLDGNGAALNLVSTRVNLTANAGINGLQTATANYDVTTRAASLT